jgi:hypothetical protein
MRLIIVTLTAAFSEMYLTIVAQSMKDNKSVRSIQPITRKSMKAISDIDLDYPLKRCIL